MPSATDIITYVGVPLALLGVLPILYNTGVSFLKRISLRRTCRRYGLNAVEVRGEMISGHVNVTFHIPEFNGQHLFKYTGGTNAITAKLNPNGSWLPLKDHSIQSKLQGASREHKVVVQLSSSETEVPPLQIRGCDLATWILLVGGSLHSTHCYDPSVMGYTEDGYNHLVRIRDPEKNRRIKPGLPIYLVPDAKYSYKPLDLARKERAMALHNIHPTKFLRTLYPGNLLLDRRHEPWPATKDEPTFCFLRIVATGVPAPLSLTEDLIQHEAENTSLEYMLDYFLLSDTESLGVLNVSLGDLINVLWKQKPISLDNIIGPNHVAVAWTLGILAHYPDHILPLMSDPQWGTPDFFERILKLEQVLQGMLTRALAPTGFLGSQLSSPPPDSEIQTVLSDFCNVANESAADFGFVDVPGLSGCPELTNIPNILKRYDSRFAPYRSDSRRLEIVGYLAREFNENQLRNRNFHPEWATETIKFYME